MSLETSCMFLLNIKCCTQILSAKYANLCAPNLIAPDLHLLNLMYNLQERTAGWSLGSSALSFSSPVVYNTASSLYLAPIQQERNTAQQVNNLFRGKDFACADSSLQHTLHCST